LDDFDDNDVDNDQSLDDLMKKNLMMVVSILVMMHIQSFER
jgi:hypothetical protein